MELMIVLGVIVFAHILIIVRSSFMGLVVAYIIGTIIWIFYPGYETGWSGWILTELVIIGLSALGSLLPNGGVGIGLAAIGGFLIGRNIAKL